MGVNVYLCEWRPLNGSQHPRLVHKRDLVNNASSVEELPQWIQERYAVLRLLDDDEDSPFGGWMTGGGSASPDGLAIFIVAQPGDPLPERE